MRSLPIASIAFVASLAAIGCGPVQQGPEDTVGVDAVANDSITASDAPPNVTDSGPPSENVDPNCTDGRYTEPLPNTSASIADIAFNANDVAGYYAAVLARRYPNGGDLVQGGLMNTSLGNCVTLFSGSPTTAAEAISRLDTVVHECGHLYDLHLSNGLSSVYYFTGATRFSCQRGDTTSRGGDTFARSRIRTDSYSAMWPACSTTGGTTNCDSYADIYLDGNPDDSTFDSGDQGFNLLFEEDMQYVNSLATAWAFEDQAPSGRRTSARDGILNFLWYTERYLHMARTTYPAAYQRLSTDPCWRDAILTLWGRAWLYLQATQGMRALGIDDARLLPLVTNPELLDEIERIRTAASCP